MENNKLQKNLGFAAALSTVVGMVIGGGSDANILAALGYQSAILSIGMYEPHAVTEYLKIDEMWDTLKVVRNMMDI